MTAPHGADSAAARVKLLCLDVDGVLTDGTVALDDLGHETKRFHARDGLGIRLWTRLGGQVAVITGRSGLAVRHRLEELGVRLLYSGSADKLHDLHAALRETGLTPAEAAFVGDDLPDLPAMRACGYPVAVRDAAQEVLAIARYVTAAPAVRMSLRRRRVLPWNTAPISSKSSPPAPCWPTVACPVRRK